MTAPLKVVGAAEVAHLLGIHPMTVGKWRRSGKLPDPDALLACGPIWRRTTITTWALATGRVIHRSDALPPDA